MTPHTAIGTLIPCTIQKFLSPLRMCYCTLGSFPGTSSGFLRIDAFPVKGAQIHICSFFFFFFFPDTADANPKISSRASAKMSSLLKVDLKRA